MEFWSELINELQIIFLFIWNHIFVVNCLLAVIIIFFQRKDANSVWAWLLILYFIPIVGFVFYLLIGTDMHKQKMFRTKEIEDRLNGVIQKQEFGIRNQSLPEKNPLTAEYADLILFNLEASGAILSGDNDVTIYTDGRDKFDALIEDIRQAKEFIHLQYYIIRNDEVFSAIREVLLQKVAEGVEIRILYDGMGCRSVRKSYWRDLRDRGILTTEFFPARLRRLHLRINYRNHRKIVVIDGRIGYVGGFNVGREYLGLNKRFGYWRDTHLRLEGTAVQALQERFILDWNFATREKILQLDKYLPEIPLHPGNHCDIQIVTSGPDSRMQNVRNNYLRMITKAKKSIYIQTPYFIPDESMLSALMIALYSGIEVYLMIPCKPDHPFVYWATYSYVGDLVMAGARCYTYEAGFLHAKGIIVDEKVLCYGTANMDIRSFQLNFEVNAIIFDMEKAKEMTAIFKKDLEKCKLITKNVYLSRNLWIRIREQVSRMLSPLL